MREWRNWQTRWIQSPVGASSCRFKSCLPHHLPPNQATGLMFWFMQNKFVGSYFAFSFANLS